MDNNLGALASLAGVAIALVGFGITIWNTRRSRSAAEQAKEAAVAARDRIAEANTIADLSSALEIMEDLKGIHRRKEWLLLPYRYSQLRRMLISIKSLYPGLSDKQKSTIQGTITRITSIETMVENELDTETKSDDLKVAEINRVVLKESVKLTEMMVAIQHEVSGSVS